MCLARSNLKVQVCVFDIMRLSGSGVEIKIRMEDRSNAVGSSCLRGENCLERRYTGNAEREGGTLRLRCPGTMVPSLI